MRDITVALEKRGAKVIRYPAGAYTKRGVPDLLACYRGRFVAIEVKEPGEKPSSIQNKVMREIHTAFGVVFVARSAQEALDLLDAGMRSPCGACRW